MAGSRESGAAAWLGGARLLLSALLGVAGVAGAAAQEAAAPEVTVVPDTRHPDLVNRVAVARDASLVASAGRDGTIRLWNAESGRLLRIIQRKPVDVAGDFSLRALAFTPDGEKVAGFGPSGVVEFFDVRTGARVGGTAPDADSAPAHAGKDGALVFSRDGSKLVVVANGAARIMAAQGSAYKDAQPIDIDAPLCGAALSPDEKTLVTGGRDGTVRLWNAETGEAAGAFNAFGTESCAVGFSPDGGRVISRAVDATIRIWNVETKHELHAYHSRHGDWAFRWPEGGITAFEPDNHPPGAADALALSDVDTRERIRAFLDEPVTALAVSPDGAKLVAATAAGAIQMLDTATGKAVTDFGTDTVGFERRGIHPDGTSALATNGKKIGLWSGATGHRTWLGKDGEREVAGFSADGSTVAAFDAQTVWLWDGLEGDPLATLEAGPEIDGVALSADGALVLAWTADGAATLWERDGGAALGPLPSVPGGIADAAFSPDGAKVALLGRAAKGDRSIVVANTVSRAAETEIRIKGEGAGVAFSPAGKAVHLTDAEGRMIPAVAWSAETGVALAGPAALAAALEGETDAVGTAEGDAAPPKTPALFAFSADDETIAAAKGGEIVLGDAASGAIEKRLDAGGAIHSFAFSPDSRQIVAGGKDGTIKLFDAASGTMLFTWYGKAGDNISVRFARDGVRVVAEGSDGSVRLWSAETGIELAETYPDGKGGGIALTPAGFFSSSDGASAMLNIVHGLDVLSMEQFHQALYRPNLVGERMMGDPNGHYAVAAAELNLANVLASGPPPRVELAGQAMTEDGRAVRVDLDVTDRGGGVGRVEWRLNGVTEQVTRGAAALADLTDAFDRVVPLAPGKNVVEVVVYNEADLIASAPIKVEAERAEAAGNGKLFVLAIGVDNYVEGRLKLAYAVKDARSIGAALAEAGKGLFEEVIVTAAAENEATAVNLDRLFTELGGRINREDTFILFVAGHGKTVAERYYFIPQDFRYGGGRTIPEYAIGQDQWQDWLARIPALKSLLVFDTCESETISALARSLDARDTAIGLLRHAVGRSVIAASRAAEPAYEGYKGHGLLSYALLQSLSDGDVNKNGLIEIDEIARHVRIAVPELALQQYGMRQDPKIKITDLFPLGNISEVALVEPGADGGGIAKDPTHVLIMPVTVASTRGEGSGELPPGTMVRVLSEAEGKAVIARDGVEVGTVPAAALAALQ